VTEESEHFQILRPNKSGLRMTDRRPTLPSTWVKRIVVARFIELKAVSQTFLWLRQALHSDLKEQTSPRYGSVGNVCSTKTKTPNKLGNYKNLCFLKNSSAPFKSFSSYNKKKIYPSASLPSASPFGLSSGSEDSGTVSKVEQSG